MATVTLLTEGTGMGGVPTLSLGAVASAGFGPRWLDLGGHPVKCPATLPAPPDRLTVVAQMYPPVFARPGIADTWRLD